MQSVPLLSTFPVPFLSLAIWVPILFGILILLTGSDSKPAASRWLALIGSIVSLMLTIPLIAGFNDATAAMQFVELHDWIPEFNIAYHLGIDGISLWLVVLTAFTTLIIVIASWNVITYRVAQYLASFLFLSGMMTGVFASLDGMLFFVFFEATLIPMYLLIGAWGGASRVAAAMRFFFFSLIGSLLMLVALLYLHQQSHTFDMEAWRNLQLGFKAQLLIFMAFFAAFAVKVPMWPVHTWLPQVHLEAPTGASVMLSMLKLGAYGFLRFSLPITPDASHFFAPVMIVLSLVAVIYGSLVALAQVDMSKLAAYSSVAHMGLVTLGLFVFNGVAAEGAIVQMISYGFVSGALFLCIGVFHERTHTGAIDAYGGVANVMPKFAVFAMIFAMANVGLPGTSGFVGEFLVILGAIKFSFWIGALAGLTLILSAAYTLSMYKRVFFGAVANHNVAQLLDIGKREFVMLGAMAALVLFIGVYPRPITDAIGASSANLLTQAQRSKQPVENEPIRNASQPAPSEIQDARPPA